MDVCMPDSQSPPDPTIELELAYDALNEADVLRTQGGDRGAISRLYYACFHGAQAVLYDRGFDPQTHRTAIRWFGREVVISGDASEADGSFFNEMYDLRTEADYKQTPPTENVGALYSRTEMFVDDMAALLDGNEDTDEE